MQTKGLSMRFFLVYIFQTSFTDDPIGGGNQKAVPYLKTRIRYLQSYIYVAWMGTDRVW